MTEPSASPTKLDRLRAIAARGWVQGVLVGVLTLVGMLYYQFVPTVVDTDEGPAVHAASVGFPDPDSYYHVKMGYLYRTGEVQAAGPDFHWSRESLWANSFSDKDFLFHVYLVPFTLLADGPADAQGLATAGKLGTAVLGLLLVLTLFAVMRGFGLRHAWVYALCLAAVGGTYIIFRLNMCRSYLMALAFVLTGWLMLARGRRLPLFLISIAYTLSYTASHLLLALAVIRAASELLVGPRADSTRWKDLKSNLVLMACIAAGIAVGCILHPNSLELVRVWWVQNVVVLALSHRDTVAPVVESLGKILGLSADLQSDVELSLGRELEPATGPVLAFSSPLILFSPIVLPLLAAILGHRPARETILTSGAALAFLVAYMVNIRFIEYAAPFMVVAIGMWLEGILGSDGYRSWMEKRPVWSRALPISGAVIALIASLSMWIGTSLSYRIPDYGSIEPAGRWLHNNPEAHGKVVWHDRWDEFTDLIFFASECDYLIGLDPTFFYVHDAQKYKAWVEIKRGKRREFLDTIKDDFNADYILAHRGSSEYFYNRLNDYAQQGKLELCVRAQDDEWALYRVVK
ncbi:MAG: hypothetical protein IT464_08170 [Planctomycetes bacterium]|nr:hypothetical protein [Planctomycetota bacterium]